MNKIKFNLNDEVLVKLNEYGYQILLAYYSQFDSILNKFNKTIVNNHTLDTYKKKADANGYTKFQLWEFMKIFGSHMKLGSNNPVDLTILLDLREL